MALMKVQHIIVKKTNILFYKYFTSVKSVKAFLSQKCLAFCEGS